MKKRLISALLCLCMLASLIPAIPVFAAEGDLPSGLYLAPSESSNLPSRIDVFPDPSASSSSNLYHLYLPGNVSIENCFLSWEGGLSASYAGKTYASGELPIPAPNESGEVTFTNGSSTKKFIITTYQGSVGVKPIFIEIDESQGTIAAMHADNDHLTICTGEIVIDGQRMALPQIKGRGNYSWMQRKTKHPYNFKLETKVNLLGIDSPKTKKWSLLANVNDPSLLRNKVAYDLAHQMGIGLDSASTDVWLNGVYQGTYLLTPKTDSFVPDDGFLIENNNWAEEQSIADGGDPSFRLGDGTENVSAGGGGGGWPGGGGGWPGGGGGWPGGGGSSKPTLLINIKGIGDNWLEGGVETPETVTAAAKAIRAYLEDAWEAVLATDGKNAKGKYYTDYFDLRSTAIFYVFQEFIKNLESTSAGSIFFHRDGMTDADKLLSGPAWDYDNALAFNGNGGTGGSNYLSARGWYLSSGSGFGIMGGGGIFSRLGKHQDLMDETKVAYTIYRRYYDDVCQNVLRQAELIEDSAKMNEIRDVGETMNAFDFNSPRTFDAGTEYEITYKKTDSWRDYVDNLYAYTEGRARFLRSELLMAEEPGYDATFQLGTNSSVTVYDTQDLSGEGVENPDVVYARNRETGEIDASGEGQINFVVNLKNGYQLKSVTVEPAENFNNLKGPADTGVENGYRITKVTGPVTIKVETQEFVCEHEFVDGVCVKCGEAAIQLRFACDEGVSIDVYKTQKDDSEVIENAETAFPRSSNTGDIDISGEGQVNFVVKVAPGYQLDSVTAQPTGNYKNLKGPDETLKNNGYRITKVTGNVIVTVKATKLSGGPCEHDYQAVKTPATCTAQGFTTYTCSKCGDSYVGDYTTKAPHDYNDSGVCTVCGEKLLNVTIACDPGASVTVFETQKADGPRQENAAAANPRDGDTGLIDCSGDGQVNFQVVLADGYALDSVSAEPTGSYKNLKGPADTGMENGYRITKVKGDFTITVKTVKTGPAPCEHDYQAVVTAPTCTEKGYTTYTCAKCGDSYVGDETAALGHSFGQWTATKAATCTEKGAEARTCARCGEKETRETAALGHSLTAHAAKAPTCTEPGWAAYETCSRCDYTTYAEQPALGHDYKAVVTAPTCTAKGYTTHTCARCGDSYTDGETDALGHDWDEGVITKQPTEAEKGERTYTCARCGEKRTEAIPELAHVHSYTAVVTAPTCTEAGFTTHTCACGDSYVDTPVPALGHSFGEWAVSKAATCTEKGEEARSCARCDEKETREVNALGHDYEKTVTAPTCTEAGYTTYACKRCNDSYKADETAALGHKFQDGKCTVCGADDPDYVDYTALKQAIDKAAGINKLLYTDASVAAFEEALSAAKAVTDNGGTQAEADAAAAALEAAIKALAEKPVYNPFRFDDVKDESDYFFQPVYWAYEHEPQITKGTSEKLFSPNAGCTRAQVVTFLWRALGEPAPEKKENPFKDVADGQYYYNAVLWAVEKGVTTGTSADKFSPNSTCTRGQIVTFLWRAMEKPAPKDPKNPFTDVPAGQYYTDAVLWAVENNITTGTSKTTFRPGSTCTRGQIVTFLWRALPEKEPAPAE